MGKMSTVSLIVNILVLIPVCLYLLIGPEGPDNPWGPQTSGRGILLSIYVAILVVSIGLFVRRDYSMVVALLLVQVIYKVTTPLSVGTLANPVVLSNLAIAAIHVVTLFTIWRQRLTDVGHEQVGQ